ncbi:acetoacetate decarboxylase family protein [Azohydromonas caseinilytica]|uniref:Acetoacetate decarboxylase family protein n=1 Tax=Azohydromonas caseinilytica TaxID=2728836 RepID=A0A848FH47_9BURK|nr:acetoacetate decarboxylase family protein [Azohydromonas caseinilytica]NML17583.1 acetoacetate decarboxylase family protein [Azohydromonas caseinilytica]
MSFLDAVPRHPCPALGGTPVPLRLDSLEAMAAVFGADTAAVRALLPAAGASVLAPLQWRPGRCLVSFIAVRYHEGDLGPYDELAVTVPVGRAPLPRLQALRDLLRMRFEGFIWQMPVTTERARDAGVRLAGFPKWVADLRWSEDPRWRRCSLHTGPGQPELSLACRVAPGSGPARELSLLSHTLLDGAPVVSELRLRQERWHEHPGGGGAELRLGQGPLADALRALRLGPRPLWTQVVPQAQALLFAPRSLGAE